MILKDNGKGGTLKVLEKGEVIGKGRIKGSKNKAKLASEVIELYFNSVFKKHPKYNELIEQFPNIANIATIEEVIYLVQCAKAIFKEDTNAAMFIINRARGTKPEGSITSSNAIDLPSAEVVQQMVDKLSQKF